MRSVFEFYVYDFPALLQRHLRYFLTAFGITPDRRVCMPTGLSPSDPDPIGVFIPPMFKEVGRTLEKGRGTPGCEYGVFRTALCQQPSVSA